MKDISQDGMKLSKIRKQINVIREILNEECSTLDADEINPGRLIISKCLDELIIEYMKDYENKTDLHYEIFATEELEKQINALKEKDKKINFLTYNDNLTKLPNKAWFIKNFEEYKVLNTYLNKFGVILINIDNFKNINNVHGYDYGDKVLVLISEVVKILLPKDCSLFKWHGDEFLIFFQNLEEDQEVINLVESIINCFINPFEIGEKQIYITVSIGISTYFNGSYEINEIIKNVEFAMYKSKNHGKNKYFIYDNEIRDSIYRKNDIRKYLGNSLYNNEIYVNYQPQFHMTSKGIIGYEALLRWNNDKLGQVSPAEFIPLAEESGLIFTLGNWVLRKACFQNSNWIAQGFCNVIAVNISALQFEQDNFIQIVEETLFETKLPPKYLELEITETVLIKSLEKSIKTIEKLKELGVRVSLDDFGTGYSSLNYLKKLPIDNLKIDKTFIDDIVVSEDSKAILKAIVDLAHTIKLEVIAEGIETIEQNEILKKINCDIGQGYYFSKPKSSVEIENMLRFS